MINNDRQLIVEHLRRLLVLFIVMFIAGTIVVVAPAAASAGGVQPSKTKVDLSQYEETIRAYFTDRHPSMEGTGFPIDYDEKPSVWLEDNVKGAALIQAYAYVTAPPDTATFIVWKGRCYVMPDQFNAFTTDAKVRISSDEEAIGLAKLYAAAWEPSGAKGLAATVVIESPDDIPQRVHGVDKAKLHSVQKPRVNKKEAAYDVALYTWCEMGGWVRQWDLTVTAQGTLTGSNVLIDEYAGDCEVEGAVPEHQVYPAAVTTVTGGSVALALESGERTYDVMIGGTKRFVIHWRPDDFNSGSDSDAETVVGWIEAGAINAWQRLIVDAGFNQPIDTMIDIYVWNDSAAWGPDPQPPGKGSYCSWPDNDDNQYIYITEHAVKDFATRFGVYYPTWQDSYESIVGHEFTHAIQYDYNLWDADWWILEGGARFLQTYVCTPETTNEFWQNSMLANLAGGPYNQNNAHKSMYIDDSMDFIGYPERTLRNSLYDSCIYWRYIFERYDGINTIRKIYDQVKSDDPGNDFGEQIASINKALGTTNADFIAFAGANYLEFSPYDFARDDECYQYSALYYGNTHRDKLEWATGVRTYVKSLSVEAYGTTYLDVIPNGVHSISVKIEGSNGKFVAWAFSADGTTVTQQPIALDANGDGSITIKGTVACDVVGIMISRIDTDTDTAGSAVVTMLAVNNAPEADAGFQYSADEGDTVMLDGSASYDPDGDPLRYRWDFDSDGTYDTAWSDSQVIDHVWGHETLGFVTLEVSDGEFTDTSVAALAIWNVPPIAGYLADQTVDEGDVVQFAGSASDPGSEDILTFSWDFGDGTTATGVQNPAHVYGENKVYTATMTVTDDGGASATRTCQITVNNVAPVPEAGPGAAVHEGSEFVYAGSFIDPGADTWTATVEYGDGTGVQTLALSGKSFGLRHTYPDNGPAPYKVTVTVTDDEGGVGVDTCEVTVENVAPTVMIEAIDQPNPNFVLPVVHTLTFRGTFSDPGWLDTHTALWSFGDGTTATGTLAEENSAPDATGTVTATHVYSAPGEYPVTVTVTDDDLGVTVSLEWTVHVADPAEATPILAAYIQGLPSSAFSGKEAQKKATFANIFNALDDMITDEEWNGYITALQNNVRSKADGHVDGKANDDWIKTEDPQRQVCTMVDDIVAYVRTFI